jgi:hypothetical protein
MRLGKLQSWFRCGGKEKIASTGNESQLSSTQPVTYFLSYPVLYNVVLQAIFLVVSTLFVIGSWNLDTMM